MFEVHIPPTPTPTPIKFFLLSFFGGIEGDGVITLKVYYENFTDAAKSSENTDRASLYLSLSFSSC